MPANYVDIYLLHKTWLLDNWTNNITCITVIHHGPSEYVCYLGSGNFAIMLGPHAQNAWSEMLISLIHTFLVRLLMQIPNSWALTSSFTLRKTE
jgi:hypothetical protein